MSRAEDGELSASGEQEISVLRRALQEQRRATTLLYAEAEKERELREALEAQLIEANAEIVASWDRRKEMARVIAEQQTQLGQASAELAGLKQGREKADKLISKLEQVIAHRDQMISNREQAIAKRDEALSKRELVIVNREKKIRQLKADLRARYEELAALQRHMVESSLSGKAKRLARRARGFARKSFPA
jgi:chromosome segregation ATPase